MNNNVRDSVGDGEEKEKEKMKEKEKEGAEGLYLRTTVVRSGVTRTTNTLSAVATAAAKALTTTDFYNTNTTHKE